MTFKIVLDSEGEAFVRRMLDSKRYEHASEVVLAGLRLLDDEETLRSVRTAETMAKIDEGLRSVERGEAIPVEEVFAELRASMAKGRGRAAAE